MELLYTTNLEVNLFAIAYRLFHRDFSPINGTLHYGTMRCPVDWREISMNLYETVCRQMQTH